MKREDQIAEEIAALQQERETLRSRKTLLCSCGKRSQLSKWILIRDHHYVRPYSCSGGDYWVLSDEYHVICPKCNGLGRTYKTDYATLENDNTLYNFVHEHARYFGEMLDSYDDGYDPEVLREKKKNKTQSY